MTEKVYEEFKNFTTCWLVKRHMNKMKWDLSLSKKIPAAFNNLQNINHTISLKQWENIISKRMLKDKKYMVFTNQQPKKKSIKPRLPLGYLYIASNF